MGSWIRSALKANPPQLPGLTIAPQRLHEIRNQRCANSRYSSLDQCKQSWASVERLFPGQAIRFPMIPAPTRWRRSAPRSWKLHRLRRQLC